MADQTITFDTQSGTPYGANLTINGGSNFSNTFTVKNPNGTAFDFSTANAIGIATTTGWTGSSQMTKSAAVGSTAFPAATFNVGFTSAAGGKFALSLGSTSTGTLTEGRYVYNVLVGSGATVYTIVDGNIIVKPGISSAP